MPEAQQCLCRWVYVHRRVNKHKERKARPPRETMGKTTKSKPPEKKEKIICIKNESAKTT